MNIENLTHGGLFEGIGGFSLGAEWAGIQTKWICEINHHRTKIFRKHYPDVEQFRDIRKLKSPPKVNILTGGFPCQNISVAGKFDGIIGEESQLWSEYFRIVHDVMPWYVIIENSSQLRNKGLEFILYDLSKIGYDVQWQCLSAEQFGYPHKRERLFIVAYSPEIRRRQIGAVQIFRGIAEILERPFRQVVLPMQIKRFKWNADNSDIRGHYGLSAKVDRTRLSAIGDAVIPEITEYVFKCIKKHLSLLQNVD